jgi:hypothetical protein
MNRKIMERLLDKEIFGELELMFPHNDNTFRKLRENFLNSIESYSEENDIKYLMVSAGVRHWEDAMVDGIEDTYGKLIPCRKGDYWCPIIDIETGIITNWKKGVVARVHYKVCDDGDYLITNSSNETILQSINNYVPKILDLTLESYGDYIILEIDGEGKIKNWKNTPSLKDFEKCEM